MASDEATSGSVIKNADLISPFIRGFNHLFFCSSVPYFASTSMFPVSGAEQLNISDEKEHLPINSANGAYSRFVKPGLSSPYPLGRNKFHNPSFLARFFSCSNFGECFHGLSSLNSRIFSSLLKICFCMKSSNLF